MNIAHQATTAGPRMDDRAIEILRFERSFCDHLPGAKEQAVRDTFNLPMTRYLQLLVHIINTPEALQHEPVVVSRLLRLSRRRSFHRLRGGTPAA